MREPSSSAAGLNFRDTGTDMPTAVPTPNIRTFQVFPDVPPPLAPLLELAHNLWWVWHHDAVDLFRRLDRELWEQVYHNPVKMLGMIPQGKLAAAAKDEGYLAHLGRVYEQFKEHLEQPGWYKRTYGNKPGADKMLVAYFSAEFGIHESLPVYSGGLGVLAGDHLKSASDLGLPLVAVGLFYRESYFRQRIGRDGWQHAEYVRSPAELLPAKPALTPAGQ